MKILAEHSATLRNGRPVKQVTLLDLDHCCNWIEDSILSLLFRVSPNSFEYGWHLRLVQQTWLRQAIVPKQMLSIDLRRCVYERGC